MSKLIAILDKRGRNATETAYEMLKISATEKPEAVGIASPFNVKTGKDVHALQGQDLDSHIIIGHIFSKTVKLDKPQPTQVKNATIVFEGRMYPPKKGISDAEAFTREMQQDRYRTVMRLIKEIEGDFAFAVAEPDKLIAGRDPVGLQPLFYGESEECAVLASERKTIWRIGLEDVHSFPPGHIAIADERGFKFQPIKTIHYSQPNRATMQAAAEELQALLQQSIRQRVSGLKEIAVAFSGGLDSSIIAFLAKKSKLKVRLIHVSLKNQPETEHARAVAKELELPLHVQLFTEEDVEKVVQRTVELIEEPDPIETSIGIPFYWTARKTAEMNLKVLLAGQGADELFGGYKRYVDDYLIHGSEKTRKRMFNDVARLYETNLEGDFKICNFHKVELRLPFATYRIAKFALGLPIRLKIEPKRDTKRKLVLRKAAENLGLSQLVIGKPKKAIQYATGVNNILKKIAKKNGLSIKEYLSNMFQSTNKMIQHE